MSRRRQHTPKILLVEGPNDKHVFWALLAANEARIPSGSFEIEDCGGDTRVLENLGVRLKANNDTHLGVVLDADTDLGARWTSLRRLVDSRFPGTMPEQPELEGVVRGLPGGPRLGVWLMPDNQTSGILEHFVSFLVPEGDALWPQAREYIATARTTGARFPERSAVKAEVHAWLAVQEQPGKPMGQAITARYLDASAAPVGSLLAWLERLFIES